MSQLMFAQAAFRKGIPVDTLESANPMKAAHCTYIVQTNRTAVQTPTSPNSFYTTGALRLKLCS